MATRASRRGTTGGKAAAAATGVTKPKPAAKPSSKGKTGSINSALYAIHYSRTTVVDDIPAEYAEVEYHCEDYDPLDDEDPTGVKARVTELATRDDGSWVYDMDKEGNGRVVVFSTLEAANEKARNLFAQQLRDRPDLFDPVESEDKDEQEGDDIDSEMYAADEYMSDNGMVTYEREEQFNLESDIDRGIHEVPRVSSTVTVKVVEVEISA